MSYKTVLVYLNSIGSAERLTNFACGVARKFNAHLIGLHSLQAITIYPGVAMSMPDKVVENFNADQAKTAASIKAIFDAVTEKEEFVSEWRQVQSNSTTAASSIVQQSMGVDLIILPQSDDAIDRPDQDGMQKSVIEESGRPVLVVPRICDSDAIGNTATIGWSATREAVRASHDAIPFIADGGKAYVLWVSNTEKSNNILEASAKDLAVGLDRHGVKAIVQKSVSGDITIGDVLLNSAFENGSDLIVTGAFGHSRFYDFVIGATTSHLLEHMTVPVLFSR